jgi:hypothetical protein
VWDEYEMVQCLRFVDMKLLLTFQRMCTHFFQQTTHDNSKGISLITCATRRNSPSTCDSKIHHNNMINNILPKIQSNVAGAGKC